MNDPITLYKRGDCFETGPSVIYKTKWDSRHPGRVSSRTFRSMTALKKFLKDNKPSKIVRIFK
jgi:hypothetical protein